MITDDDRKRETPKTLHSGVDYPQPGAVQEMPYSPPRTKYILGGLAAVAALFIVAVAWGIV